MRRFLLCSGLLLACLAACGTAFVQPSTAARAAVRTASQEETFCSVHKPSSSSIVLRLGNRDDDKEVNVNLIPDVDAFTLTAVGFGLIAFNFFVLANMGDAGLAGVIARIMNTFG